MRVRIKKLGPQSMELGKVGLKTLGCAVLLLSIFVFPGLSFATDYYVLAGGTGTFTGTDWGNANCKIPATLNAGDVVYIGNSGGNLADTTTACAGEAGHTFSTSGTSGSHITIKAATGADHGTATGWSAAFGVDVTPKITWSNNFVATDGGKPPFWEECGSYYDFDGKVGNADSSGSYGFYFKSKGEMQGFIRLQSSHCTGNPSIQNVTFQHFEIDGVDSAASSVLWTGVVNTSGTTVTWVSDNSGSPRSQFDTSGYWTHIEVAYGAHLTARVSSVTDATHLTLTTSIATANDVNFAVSQTGGVVFQVGVGINSPSTQVSSISFTNSFFHDAYSYSSAVGNVFGLTYANNYFYNNFGDAGSHGVLHQTNSAGNAVGVNNLDFHDNVVKNIQGTGVLECEYAQCDSWTVYNNVMYYTANWNSICALDGDLEATCGMSSIAADNSSGASLTNGVFYGNTFSGIHTNTAINPTGADHETVSVNVSASSGDVVDNNIWYNCTLGGVTAGTGATISHDYNTLLNTGYGSSMTPSANDSHQGASGQTITGGAADPFVSDSTGNFQLSSETVDPHLNDGVTLSAPYGVDLAGSARLGPGGVWVRGALTWLPNSATSLSVTGVQ